MMVITSLQDVAPDGSAKDISHGALVASLRALQDERTWKDKNGVIVNPEHLFTADEYLTPNQPVQLDIKLYPRLWDILPGHAIRLVLSTQTAKSDCGVSLAALPQAFPCNPSATQQATLPGGTYTIQWSATAPSAVNVPLMKLYALPTAPNSITATSKNLTEPLVWSTQP